MQRRMRVDHPFPRNELPRQHIFILHRANTPPANVFSALRRARYPRPTRGTTCTRSMTELVLRPSPRRLSALLITPLILSLRDQRQASHDGKERFAVSLQVLHPNSVLTKHTQTITITYRAQKYYIINYLRCEDVASGTLKSPRDYHYLLALGISIETIMNSPLHHRLMIHKARDGKLFM